MQVSHWNFEVMKFITNNFKSDTMLCLKNLLFCFYNFNTIKQKEIYLVQYLFFCTPTKGPPKIAVEEMKKVQTPDFTWSKKIQILNQCDASDSDGEGRTKKNSISCSWAQFAVL